MGQSEGGVHGTLSPTPEESGLERQSLLRKLLSPTQVKKLVYVYLVRYAEEQQDLALLSISTFQRGLKVSGLSVPPGVWASWVLYCRSGPGTSLSMGAGPGGLVLPALGWEGQSQRK